MMKWTLGILALLASVGLAQTSWAECRITSGASASVTYAQGQLKDDICDTNGYKPVTIEEMNVLISGEDQANDLLKVAPQARSLGGATLKRYISVAGATQNEHSICTAACTFYSVTVTNTNAAVRHLKCDDAAAIATTVPGTSVPELDLAIPGSTTGAGITLAFPVGAAFVNGANCWLVTGAAESDVAEVAANELKILYSFKQ